MKKIVIGMIAVLAMSCGKTETMLTYNIKLKSSLDFNIAYNAVSNVCNKTYPSLQVFMTNKYKGMTFDQAKKIETHLFKSYVGNESNVILTLKYPMNEFTNTDINETNVFKSFIEAYTSAIKQELKLKLK